MEISGNTEETLIWYNINDARNLPIITAENQHLRDFVPKVAIQKNVEIINEVIPETVIQDILTIKYNVLNVYEIMAYQVQVISYLSAKFRSTDATEITWDFYRPYLAWILVTSEFITNKFGISVDDVKYCGTVTRSSYKFCELKESCKDTYGNPLGSSKGDNSRPQRCMGDHYAHNKIVRDLRSLIGVIDSESSEQASMSHYLRLGLTTTDFVIRHMYQELGIFNTYLKDNKDFNIENYYICQKSKNTGTNSRNNTFGKNTYHGGQRENPQSNHHMKKEFHNTNTTNTINAFDALDITSSDEDSKKKEKMKKNVKEVKLMPTKQSNNAFEFLCQMSDSDEEKDERKNKTIVQVNPGTTEPIEHSPFIHNEKKKNKKKSTKKGKK